MNGETRAYAQGMSVTRVFRHQTTADKETIAIGGARRPFRPRRPRSVALVRRESPSRVTVGGATLPRVSLAELATQRSAHGRSTKGRRERCACTMTSCDRSVDRGRRAPSGREVTSPDVPAGRLDRGVACLVLAGATAAARPGPIGIGCRCC